jgi:predicted dehydrogenase
MTLGIALIGTGWMARAHTHAVRALPDLGLDLPDVRLVTVASRDKARAGWAADRLGYQHATDDWRAAIDDPGVDIVVNVAANESHAQPSIAALSAGKHVVCEKPLAIDATTAATMAAAVPSDSVAVCGYNYRFVPALRLARDLIKEGRLGTIRHVRLSYLQDWAATAAARDGWKFTDPVAGNSVADYSHIIDLLCWLVDEPTRVCASIATLAEPEAPAGLRRAEPGTDHEDWYAALVELTSGATAVLEASRVATASKGRQLVEIFGSDGSLRWDMEDMNRLHVAQTRDDEQDPRTAGPRAVLVTEPCQPFMEAWWAPGHILGWEHTLVHQWIAVLNQITGQGSTDDRAASFIDGLRACRITDAIRRSAADEAWCSIELG